MKPLHVATLGVGGYGALSMATRGWIDEEVVVVSIPVQTTQVAYGGSAGGGGPPFGYEPIPYEPEMPCEPPPDWRERLACLINAAARPVERWTTTEEVLAMAAAAASDGRLSPTVRSWAVRELIAAGGPSGVRDRIEALCGAVRSTSYDVPNPVGAQWIASADELSKGASSGACVDYCVKLGSALLSVGIPVALVGQSSDGTSFDHVAMAAWDGHGWIRVDPSDRSVPLGASRPCKREVWIELPTNRVAHRGAPPASIVAPSAAAPESFPLVGVGRLRPADPGLVRQLRGAEQPSKGTGVSIVATVALAAVVVAVTVMMFEHFRGKGRTPPRPARKAKKRRRRKGQRRRKSA